MRRDKSALIGGITSACKRALWALGKFKAIPTAMRVVLICIAVLAVFSVANLVYQILHKPTEVFALIPGESNKAPVETWRQYSPLFREYSTTSISPELLAALAQVESAGNPIARTYWRWSLTSDPFAVYQPASSAVGMYQMTDAAFAEARRYCIRHHTVVEDGCWFNGLYTRVVPSHAIDEVPPAALYVSAPMRRNSRFIAFTWARYVATSWSPQRSPAIRRKPRRAKGLAGPAPQRWIIAARSCFGCKVTR